MTNNIRSITSSNVVKMETDSKNVARSQLARLPAPVHAVLEKSKQILQRHLRVFFDRADDSLFELADKAISNQEQNLYFDSMREVRVQRRSIEKRFSETVDAAFSALVSGQPIVTEPQESLSVDTLSLVQNEDLEEMVAVDASVAKTNREFGEEIQQISLRLNSLVPVKVYQKNNPVGPDVLCHAIMTQIKRLDIGIKAKLVLFKLFDKTVIAELGDLYRAVNEVFVDHNVLPSLSATATSTRKHAPLYGHNSGVSSSSQTGQNQAVPNQALPNQSTQNSAQQNFDSSATSGDVSPEVLSALQSILSQSTSGQQGVTPEVEPVLNMLSALQKMPSQNDQGAPVRLDVRQLIGQMQAQQGSQVAIGRMNDEVINLVDMLFDFILEDRNLAEPMKAIIAKMQIPVVKVALIDKSFFTKGGHVARRLLNEMATAAIGWQGSKNFESDPLYKKIHQTVKTLVNHFDTNVELFSELLVDFTAFLEKEKRRIAVLERRTLDAEDGKARAEVARATVALEVEIRTKEEALPDVVNKMIDEVWSNVLFVNGLKFGYESKEWESALTTLEELVWSVKPPETNEDRHKLIRLVPALLKKLRAGFDSISYNPYEMSELFKSLEAVHLGCIRGKVKVPEPAKPEAAQPSKVDEQQRAALQKTAQEEKAKASPSSLTSSKVEQKQIEQNSTAEEGSVSVRTPDNARRAQKVEAQSVKPQNPQPQNPAPQNSAPKSTASQKTTATHVAIEELSQDDPAMLQVKQFVQGAWFDFKKTDGTSSRCRLAAFIKPTSRYIFVNRNGMKVAEHTQMELALALKQNRLTALDNSMLFDRALETVVTSLRKN